MGDGCRGLTPAVPVQYNGSTSDFSGELPSKPGDSMRQRVSRLMLPLILAAVPALGQQVTGSITGSVRDTTGATIEGASLKLTSVSTGTQRQSLSDNAGNFVVNGV